ncbi:NACHT, LRR and PYD domains-containing protein 3-like [Xyrauchen texanus]|uniref:NACHT, LRR and PYD domains-containing protein 3-like n=1 Tax=Xyrauchen texanus TaxID=154827 RepID=UPI002241D228|nr:NACHT, LRR and PYD domains-containing protein 3-like [Xyrauchen texanus]
MSLPEKQSVVSLKSDHSKGGVPNFSEETPSATKRPGSLVFSSVSLKSDHSKGGVPNFSEKKPSATKRVQCDTSDSCLKIHRRRQDFKGNILSIFKDLENKIITFLKNELERMKKIIKRENTQYFVKDLKEDRNNIREAALDIILYFLRSMKQDELADTLEDELVFIYQQKLKSNLKKKYQCVLEGIAKHGDSTLLNKIYTDLYITQGSSEQVNTEHEVRQIEKASRQTESPEIQIKCTSLFKPPGQDKEIRTVLTKGVAGIGKSISVQKFVLDWAEGNENQDISFIFPLPFREMNLKENDRQSLMGLISQFFPETKGLNLARNDKFKVLFVLDGLDECRLPLKFEGNETCRDVTSPATLDVLLTNLIKGNLLPSAHIWITTRPAAASKIPPEYIDLVAEVRGFDDPQKEEYFKKRFTDVNLANTIIDHIKKSKSLFIMCHIPVFCWISATVLQNILEKKRNNKSNQADDVSKTLLESDDFPKTLTQMYTHFFRFQIQQSSQKYDGKYSPDISWNKEAIRSLGKLAFNQLERNNLIFYGTDLEDCGIDLSKASMYSGMCTQIFKEETGIVLGTTYCFVHMSIQEFMAALYAHLILDTNKKSAFFQDSTEQENKSQTMIDLLKTAVDKALMSDNGHLDLFLRFLLGLSLESNRSLLQGLLTQQDSNEQSKTEIVEYIKQKFEDNASPERSINLFFCLNELNDQTLVKEIHNHLRKGSLSSADLSPAQWSALAFVLLTSEEELEEFDLQKFKKSDECLCRLVQVVKTSKRALLNDCDLTDKSCLALSTVLRSDTNLKELNMNNNNLQDSGVKLLCAGLESKKCKLQKLRLSKCELTEESCSALATVLRSDSSSLQELDLSNNNLQDSGVKMLSVGLQNNCTLEILRLSNCSITEEGYKALSSALLSNPSHLIELDLRGNDPGESGVKLLYDLLQDTNCKLKILRLLKSPSAEEACQYLTKEFGKNPLLLRDWNLNGYKLGDSKVKQIAALLEDKHCKLNKLLLRDCEMTDEGCSALTSALCSNLSHLRHLNLSGNKLKNTGLNHICDLLNDSHCKLEKLILYNCEITDVASLTEVKTVRSLKKLDLRRNKIKQSSGEKLCEVLKNSDCELELDSEDWMRAVTNT